MIHIFQAALGGESAIEAIDVNDDRSSIHNLFLNSNSGDRDTQADPSNGLTLEDKIQKAFELPRLEKRHHEYACWLVKNVLLRGYLLVTDGHLCFWANIPSDEGDVKKSGFLKKRAVGPLKNTHSYWFVLKEDALNIYADSKSLYYPVTRIALRDVTKIEISNKKDFGFAVSTSLHTSTILKMLTRLFWNKRQSS